MDHFLPSNFHSMDPFATAVKRSQATSTASRKRRRADPSLSRTETTLESSDSLLAMDADDEAEDSSHPPRPDPWRLRTPPSSSRSSSSRPRSIRHSRSRSYHLPSPTLSNSSPSSPPAHHSLSSSVDTTSYWSMPTSVGDLEVLLPSLRLSNTGLITPPLTPPARYSSSSPVSSSHMSDPPDELMDTDRGLSNGSMVSDEVEDALPSRAEPEEKLYIRIRIPPSKRSKSFVTASPTSWSGT